MGVLLALFMANAGGAWDNAKKYIEARRARRQGRRPAQGRGGRRHRGRPLQGHLGPVDEHPDQAEAGHLGGKGADAHRAAVVGDTVGDPLKDTAGPSMNILIKLMSVVALVIAPLFR